MSTRDLAVMQAGAEAEVIAVLDRLESGIKQGSTAAEILDLVDQARGLQSRWRRVKHVADRAGKYWVMAECRLGEEWDLAPKARARGSNQFRRKERSNSSTPPLKDIAISRDIAARWLNLARLDPDRREELIDELIAEDKAVTPNAVLTAMRLHKKKLKRENIANAVFSETGPFDVVVIDPPWPMQKIDRYTAPNQDAFDYEVMTEEELTEFWPDEIADKLSPDCHVFIWTTQKFVPMALRLLEPWRLNYVLLMVWHKPGGFQPFDLPQFNCEFIIYARHGAPVFIDTKDFPCCFEAPRREHSRKPEYFYDLVRRVTGGSRIDVFAREHHEGFARFGNEVDKFL
jgi:N6-adenosine-specific RNA methylase IME4